MVEPGSFELRWRWLAIIALCSTILGALTAAAIYRPWNSGLFAFTASTDKAVVGGPFALVDMNGRRVTDRDFWNRPAIVTFGYTIDPDQTPASLQVMRRIIQEMGAQADRVHFVFITLDPGWDTPSRLKAYLEQYDRRIQGLTGNAEDIAAVARSYKMTIIRDTAATQANRQSITFDTLIFLMNARGVYVAHVTLDDHVMPFIHRLKEVL